MSPRSTRRIVVTGLGLITPLGMGVEKTWKAICAGESGIGRITRFDPAAYDAQARRLAGMFRANFEAFASGVTPAVAAAGPRQG